MERKQYKVEDLKEVNEGEFLMLLSQIAQGLMRELEGIQSMPTQIRMQENAQYNVKYYVDPEGNPVMTSEKKKPMGFDTNGA